MEYLKGDIIWVPDHERSSDKLRHAAVLWDKTFDGQSDFRGIMLTRAAPNEIYDNILMAPEYFMPGFEYEFSNTHFVNQVFWKFHHWGHFYLSGKLTCEGVKFIEERLTNIEPVEFREYSKVLER